MIFTVCGPSRADFIARAPMHTFRGWITEGLKATMDMDLAELRLNHIQASAPTRLFDTGNTEKNSAMAEFFSFDEHPQAHFSMTECRNFTRNTATSYTISLLGILEIGGVRRQLPLTCKLSITGDTISLNLKFKWSFKAFGFKQPSLLLLKVRDIVDISAHLKFCPAH